MLNRPNPTTEKPLPAEVDGRQSALDCFATEEWFDLLAEHGFAQFPVRHVVPLNGPSGQAAGRLHLMLEGAGAPLSSLSNYYTGLFAPSGLAEVESVDWALAAHAIVALPASHVLRLQPLSDSARWGEQLIQALRNRGYSVDTFFCFGNWFLPVSVGGFEAYWLNRPSPLRHSVDRGRRRLGRTGAWRIQMYQQASDDLDGAIDAFVRVYASSWKPAEPNPWFIPKLIRLAARRGWLRLGVLWLDGQPVAAQLWLVSDGKANIFKLAHVQGQERLSAGSVLTSELMRHVMDVDGVREVDFLSGDDAYKADWMTHRRERLSLVAFHKRQPAAWVPALRHWAGVWWRKL